MRQASLHDVLIIGAGPAGLALGACLAAQGVRATLLEAGQAPGWSWHRRYDSLRLHTTRRASRLPRMAIDGDADRYPTAAQFAAYCERYAAAAALDVRLGAEVRALARRDGRWRAQTDGGLFEARVAVIATGAHRLPWRPPIAGEDRFAGTLLHSNEYRNGKAFRGQRVLVVGGGNTALDLVADLHAHGALPALALRGPLQLVTHETAGLNWHLRQRAGVLAPLAVARRAPAPLADALRQLVARLAVGSQRRRFGDLEALGVRLADGETILRRAVEPRPPTIDGDGLALVRRGVVSIHPELVALEERAARFAPPAGSATGTGDRAVMDAVILATGFRAGFDALLDGAAPAATNLLRFGEVPLLSSIRRQAPACARRVLAALSA